MASSLPLLMFFLASTVLTTNITQATSKTIVAKDLVPCTMCTECENPCQPLPPPPPPVVECPPPPPPSPPPPSPPRPPAVVDCPPPPKTTTPCQSCEIPQGPPRPQYPPGVYYPPGTQYPYYVPDNNVKNSGAMMKPLHSLFFTPSFIYVACLCLPYYLFI